jgi:hypothetical protein
MSEKSDDEVVDKCASCGRMQFPRKEHRFYVWLGFEIGVTLCVLAFLIPFLWWGRLILLAAGVLFVSYAFLSFRERNQMKCPGCASNIGLSGGKA